MVVKSEGERFFSYKMSIARITIKNLFGTLKACFKYMQHAMDINKPTQKLYILALHYTTIVSQRSEKFQNKGLALAWTLEKRV